MTPASSRSNDRLPDELDPTTLPEGAEVNPTRLRILLAGLNLFGSQGYYGTSIRDIAAAAGLQSASLYDHFASKEAILTELVFIGHNAHHQILLQALLNSEPGPREQLRALINVHVASHCQYAALGRVSNYERHHLSAEAYTPAATLREHSSQLLVDVIARGKAQGVFDLTDEATTVGALGAFGMSVLNWYPMFSGDKTPEEVGATYAELALRMLGSPDT